MMNRAAVSATLVAALGLFASQAHADDGETTTTTTANTLVVVTPNAPVVVQTNGAQVAPAGPASVAPALAPPGAAEMPPAPPAPPQNEDWNNVSHINGTPVPVGERGQYLYKFKTNNIAVNPFGLFFGLYDVSATHAMSQNVALSAAVTIVSTGSVRTTYQFTASAPIYFKRTYSGPFLEPGLIVRGTSDNYDYAASGCSSCSSSSDSWVGPELLFGWHWTFDSGLNIMMAGGVAKRITTSSDSNTYGSSSSAEGNAYFRVGYAF